MYDNGLNLSTLLRKMGLNTGNTVKNALLGSPKIDNLQNHVFTKEKHIVY